jgi:transcriptional antiterminator NusG
VRTAQRWIAVWTKPRAEKIAARVVESMGVRIWLPLLASTRRWSDREKVVEVPLFPGYLFAQVSMESWTSLLHARGVLTVVKSGSRPAWIGDDCIDQLRRTVELAGSGTDDLLVEEEFFPGDIVRVVDGPFARLTGTIREVRGGGRRLLVGIEQIGRAVSVSLGAASVELITHSRSSSDSSMALGFQG